MNPSHFVAPRHRRIRYRAVALLGTLGLILGLVTVTPQIASAQVPTTNFSIVNGDQNTTFQVTLGSGSSAIQADPLRSESDTPPLEAGDQTFNVYGANADPSVDSPLNSVSFTAAVSDHYLLAIRPSGSGPLLDVYPISKEPTARGTGRVQFVNAAAGTAPLSVTITGEPVQGSPIASSFQLGSGESFSIPEVPPGRYDVRATRNGTVVYDADGLRLDIGEVNVASFVGDLVEADPDNLAFTRIAIGEIAAPVVHVVNAFDAATQYDIAVDGQQSRSGVEGLRRSGILPGLEAGEHEIVVTESVPGGASVTLTINVENGKEYDLAIYPGTQGQLQAELFPLDLQPIRANSGRMIIRHLAQAGDLAVRAQSSCENQEVPDDKREITLSNGESHAFDQLVPNDYQVDFGQPGTTTIVASGPDVELDAGLARIVYVMSTNPAATPGAVKSYAYPLTETGTPLTYANQGPARCQNPATGSTASFPATSPQPNGGLLPESGSDGSGGSSGNPDSGSGTGRDGVVQLAPEFATSVGRLYAAVFNRQPDQAGFDYWTGIRNEASLQQIAGSFVTSPEFRSTYGDTTNDEFVTLLYRNVLGRTPDTAGRNYWVNLLETGQARRSQIVIGFSESAEFRQASSQ